MPSTPWVTRKNGGRFALNGSRPSPPGEFDKSGAERRMAGGIGAKKVDVTWATEESGFSCLCPYSAVCVRIQLFVLVFSCRSCKSIICFVVYRRDPDQLSYLYHFTSVSRAVSILGSKDNRRTPMRGNRVEMFRVDDSTKYMPPFYLCTGWHWTQMIAEPDARLTTA